VTLKRALVLSGVHGLGALGLAGLLAPVVPLALGAPLLVCAALLAVAFARGPAASGWIVALSVGVLAPLGLAECAARIAIAAGLCERPLPMKTMQAGRDWRVAHITADERREYDPVLFWRPVARPPYNEQHFRGPVMSAARPAGVVRIMAYGDSNTDGPPGPDDWVARLQELEASRRGKVEAVNAGCAGYSSHQGLLRFRQDVGVYRPDVVLVSFGWNDLPRPPAGPDKTYRAPGRIVATLLRGLVRFDAFLLLRQWRTKPVRHAGAQPRVSLPDYVHNLRRFVQLGRAHHASVLLLTRPHQARIAELLRAPGWRSRVPEYNRALLAFARESGAMAIDVEGHFESLPWEMFDDECHFSAAGRAEMARFVEGELRRRRLVQ